MPRSRAAVLIPFVLAVAPAASAGEPEAWSLDPVHTRVLVAVDHAGFSQALGTASGSTGALLFEPGDWSSARLEVRVPLSNLDFGDPDWNRAVLGPRLLDVGDHPEARFTSDNVVAIDERQARVCGTLALHGIERPQCLEVTVNAVERHPMPPFRRTAGFSAHGTLSRAAFGLEAWPTMVGDSVALRIEAEAVLDRDAADAFDAPSREPAVTPPPAPSNDDPEAAAREAADAAAEEEEPTP